MCTNIVQYTWNTFLFTVNYTLPAKYFVIPFNSGRGACFCIVFLFGTVLVYVLVLLDVYFLNFRLRECSLWSYLMSFNKLNS